ncbi:MAG: pyridoxamine 5'-phosphate oxidase family protein [Proteobacteria bacterium]|nr:pyridoxamine 5'-phosphate oxidase family protein [Pseudomonadota bacterium]MBU1387275.1 pyridoxamine 5'-phosphate oxidase family protein [Pseudomonadota bacterium]MBU1544256.1 pyridoxamine 5'-phosphate oxidase family protein [Pseudomonadota bacterium]MBU2430917.1 pyridoxamine 5'-phosphate oxidase family protein [Pseudomonadota bacterium]MBU2481496.1 pyridoxamine 5'-phosphate oxidase family protein [Pseudomonadota bacterium]
MNLKDYFEITSGTGILSTADSNGYVDAAIYSRPHFLEDKIAFIMRNRLSHQNLESNPHAVYLFIEDGPGSKGKRIYLTKVKEEKNSEQIATLKRREKDSNPDEDKFLVFFKLDHERPLVGDDH